MIISRIYNNPNNIILNFDDSELRHYQWPLVIDNDKISFICSNAKYGNAINIDHKGKGSHSMRINWGRVTMSAPVESFTIKIKYGTDVRITAQVQIKYPLISTGLKYTLSISQGTWGTNPNCILNIKPTYSNTDSWKYADRKVCVSFTENSESIFFPDDKKHTRIFDAKTGVSIPLACKFPNEILRETRHVNIHFSLDQQTVFLPFTFTPIQINNSSYKIELNRLCDDYQYGTPDKKIFKVTINPQSRFIPIGNVEFRFRNQENPFYHKEIGGEHYLLICARNVRWTGCDTTYSFEVIVNNICYSKEIHISPNNVQTSNYLKIKPGEGPDITILPSNSIELFQGQKQKIGLQIHNPLLAPLTISRISTYTPNNCVVSVLFNNNVTIQPDTDKLVHVEIQSKNIGKGQIEIKTISKAAESTKSTISLNVKEKEDSRINVEYLHDENFSIIVQKKYLSNERCGQIIVSELNRTDTTQPYIKNDFCFDSNDFELQHISDSEDGHIYELTVKEGAFCNPKSIPIKEDKGHFYVLQWQYHDQKGELYIPIKKASLYNINISNLEPISFPHIGDDRKIIIGKMLINDPTDADCILDDNQCVVIDKPFYFEEANRELQNIEIHDQKTILIGVNIDEINGINTNTKNINDRILLDLNVVCKGAIVGTKKLSRKIEITPIIEDPKRNVFFETNEGTEVRVRVNTPTTVSVNIQEQSEEVLATKVGSIRIRNLAQTPYKEYSLRCTIKNMLATCGSTNCIHQDTFDYVGRELVIFNGDNDTIIPIYIDYKRLKQCSSTEHLSIRLDLESTKQDETRESTYKIDLELVHQFFDDIFSLDLGTTGIVVAKERDGIQEIVKLEDDQDDPIEKEDEIISSHTMLIAKDSSQNESGEFILSPSGNEYYGNTTKKRFRLVPSKFIIGQERIPFLSEYYANDNLNKKTKLFAPDETVIDLSLNKNKEVNRNTISEVISSLYKNIFNRFSQDTSQIKKLVITYPNTYTIENLDSIENILREELHLNLKGQISFVPESDAVAAYYFDQKIMHEGGFFDTDGSPKDVENVIIYDMGAGTLDLSLISFKQKGNDSITASIINKIGIPLAGNYLDYIICKSLLDSKIMDEELTEKHNTIKEISTGIKQNYSPDVKIKEQSPVWYTENNTFLKLGDQTYANIFENSLKNFLETCSKTILELLIPKDTKIDTIVFSGRASRFASLRESVKASLKELMGVENIKEDSLKPTSDCGDCLKTCVAIGALKYQSFFNNNDSFRIENKNIYSKIAIVYWGKNNGRFGVNVKFLIDPQSEHWGNAEFINGTWCKEFCTNETISDHLPGKELYYIQTCLDEKRLQDLFKKVYLKETSQYEDLNWSFVNVLFRFRIIDSKPFEVSLKISKENKIIERKISTALMEDTKLLENVEDNILYKRSMWPFITKLK